jgi:hypothetical protein
MSPRVDALRRLGRAGRGVSENAGRRGPLPSDRTRMLFYEPDPSLRTDLIGAGILTLRLPTAEPVVPSSALAIAERVRSAYRTAAAEANDYPGSRPSGQWDRLIARSYGDLTRALDGDDARLLASTLERMFAAPTTAGLSMGGEVGYLSDAAGRDFYVDWWIDGLYSVASYLGLLREAMDTAQSPIDSVASFEALYNAVGERLGAAPEFPAVCGAWGIEVHGTLVPRTSWRHLHAAHAMLDETASLGAPRIVEVGGGFGGVAYWAQRLRPDAIQYAIYDFPIMNAIAGYFLLRALPSGSVLLHGEPPRPGPQIALLPNWRIFEEPDRSADIAFNQDSLPEMPREAALTYLEVFDRIARIGFYSENQEDAHAVDPKDPNSSQLRLPDLDDVMRRLRRASRHRAWMRRGYFETFYRPKT